MAVAVVVGLAVPTWYQVLPAPGAVSEEFARDRGDPVLLMWVMESVIDDPVGTPGDILDGNIFHPYEDTLAWSDNLVLLAPLYGLAHWASGGDSVFAYNVVSFIGYLAGALAVFALARWLLGSTTGAFIAALAFTTAPYRTVLVGHTQLVGILALPLALLFLFRFLRERHMLDAGLVGVSVGVAWYTATYFAVLSVVLLPVAAGVWLLQARFRPALVRRPELDRGLVAGGALAAVVAAVVVAPTLPAYLGAQGLGFFERPDATIVRGSWEYFTQLPPSGLYRALFDRQDLAGDRGGWYPGALVVVGVAVLLVALVRRWRCGADVAGDPEDGPSRAAEFLLPLVAVGAASLLLSFGPAQDPWGLPYRAIRTVVPGVSSFRDTGRFWLVALVVLAVLAGHGVATLVAGSSRRRPFVLVLVAVSALALVAAETLYRPGFTTLDRSDEELAVYRTLDALPPGVVTEAPIPTAGPYPFVVAPRQLRSLIDDNPRLEGYSGTAPPELELDVSASMRLPAPAAVAYLQARGVRYVVLHVGPAPCISAYSVDEARSIADRLSDQEAVRAVRAVPGSLDLVVELVPSDAPVPDIEPYHDPPPRSADCTP